MATKSQGVQPTAWMIQNNLPDAVRYVRVLSLPTPILRSIQSLNAQIPKVPPFASLNDALAAFSRDIIAFHPYHDQQKEARRWLYARMGGSLDPTRLLKVIKVWLIACYGGQRADALIKSWSEQNWVWDELDLQHADDATKRMLLPGLVARWLVDQKYALTLEENGRDTEMPLHLVPLMTQRYVAELLTAPREYKDERYAFVVRLWLEPMPGALCLQTRTSLRRWANKPLIEGSTVYLKRGRGRSVYLRRTTGYLDMQAPDTSEPSVYEDVYARITMKYVGGGASGLHWVGNQAKVFDQLRLQGAPPDVTELATQPSNFYDRALIVVENRQSRMQDVETGLQPADHRRIFDDLNAHIGRWAATMPVWHRVLVGDPARGSSTNQNPKEADNEARFQGLLQMPHPVRIELHTSDTDGTKTALLEAVGLFEQYQGQLGDNPLCVIHEGKLLLEIVHGDDEHLTDLLPESANQSNDVQKRAMRDRRNAIARRYAFIDQPAGALISILPYHTNKATERRDPKHAVRYGLIDSGRVSQFFEPRKPKEAEESYARRLQNAASDLLRSLGYRLSPYYIPIGDLPDEVELLAPYVIQLNSRTRNEQPVLLPVMVHALAGSHQLRVYVPRPTGSAELYITLREGTSAAARFEGDFPEAQVTSFFRDAIRLHTEATNRAGSPERTALMLVCDQNLRRVFPELAGQNAGNPAISLNNILTAPPHIRVARLRFSADGEAAHCVPEDPAKGKYQGLYTHPAFPNVFYSLHNLGDRPASGGWNKLDWLTRQAVNASTVQIWLNNLQQGDHVESWAALVHQLRRASSHTHIETLLPQLLHDVQIIHDYISRLAQDDTEDDLNAIEATEG